MKTRMLGAALAIAALSGLLVASPAQARDGVSSARVRVDTGIPGGGALVTTTVDFVNRRKVIFRNFTVRDLCPGDNRPVQARAWWHYTDGTTGKSAVRTDSNGCGDDGTNFGNITPPSTKGISSVYLEVWLYTGSGTKRRNISLSRYNQYVHPGR
ncbi:hypothetical protein ACBJ59_44020 [Nonomuraea sp. MTCD27]|uniref:hypothetical protein n=1 Tax=Nonomuraea sp. MTCD27 TaxID=1676747 RepID=UPI0035C09B4F